MFLDFTYDGDGDPFPVPVPPPDADPASGDLIKIAINRAWLPYITGACTVLALEKTWAVQSDEELILVQMRALDLLHRLHVPAEEPPFYDSEEDVDNTVEPSEPWYESLSDWVISAFLATTFTPGAAILYKTSVPKIRLAFRTGNFGAIAQVLLNGIEIFTQSTSTPDVGALEANLDLQGFALMHQLNPPPWTLQIVHLGPEPQMRLMEDTLTSYKLEVELGDIRQRTGTMQLRQNGCVLEVSLDGLVWTVLYDPVSCIGGEVSAGIQQAITDGKIEPGDGQPSPTTAPAPGQCQNYHVKLKANDQWRLPSQMGYDDTLTITNLKGTWSDGSATWFCPDGSPVVNGVCTPANQTHMNGDLLNPGAPHMALVMKAGDTWFPAPTTEFINQAGTTPIDVLFEANDGTMLDNSGAVEFDVEVCTGGWVHTFDAAHGLANFDIYEGYGHWNGTEWVAVWNPAGNVWQLYIALALPTNANTTYKRVTAIGAVMTTSDALRLYSDSTRSSGVIWQGSFEGGLSFGANHHGGSWLLISPDEDSNGSATVTSVTFSGDGVDPFSGS